MLMNLSVNSLNIYKMADRVYVIGSMKKNELKL